MALIYFLNVDSNKTQKLCATASPDLPDPQQTAVPVRTTRGRAAKRDVAGQFVCIDVHETSKVWCQKCNCRQLFRPNWASSVQCSTRWASHLNRRPKAPRGFK